MKRATIVSLCVSLTLELLLGAGGVVIFCIGTNGHLEIETASSQCCTGASAETDPTATTARLPRSGVADGQCGPCTDIPVGRPSASVVVAKASRAVHAPDSHAGLVRDFSPSCERAGSQADAHALSCRIIPVSSQAPRSTILLI